LVGWKQQIHQIPGRGEWAYDAILYHVALGPLRSGALATFQVTVDRQPTGQRPIRDGSLERH
jgi:hypothetical protein